MSKAAAPHEQHNYGARGQSHEVGGADTGRDVSYKAAAGHNDLTQVETACLHWRSIREPAVPFDEGTVFSMGDMAECLVKAEVLEA